VKPPMKDIELQKKWAIVAECRTWTDPVTGKIVHGGLKQVMMKFPNISKRSIMRFNAESKLCYESQYLVRYSKARYGLN